MDQQSLIKDDQSPPSQEDDRGPCFIEGRDWLCVVWIRTQVVGYIGQSVHDAARALVPGTCYGIGDAGYSAEAAALSKARHLRREVKCVDSHAKGGTEDQDYRTGDDHALAEGRRAGQGGDPGRR